MVGAAVGISAVAMAMATAPPTTSPYGGRIGPTFNLLDFGAKGDNATLNTQAFEKGVDAVSKAGGGTLYVPDGDFLTAPFNMTSHMTLYLSGGATVRGPTTAQLGPSPSFPLWPIIPPMKSYGQGRDHPGPRRTSLIHGEDLTDVVVTSHPDHWGTIDGHGQPWWAAHKAKTETVTRGHLIEFMSSEHIEISNLNLRNSPFWTVHPVYSRHVVVRNIDIKAPHDSPNTDGVDPESSQDVLIENFTYEGGDDAIAIKSGWDCFGYRANLPCKNIHIRNVTSIWTRAAGCAIGSEMSGGMENITLTDCDFTHTGNGLYVKYSKVRGGYVKDIHFKNVLMGNITRAALSIDSGYGDNNPACGRVPKKMPVPVSNVTYTNITQASGTVCDYMIDFKGLSDSSISDVRLDGVHLNYGKAVQNCEMVAGTYRDAPGAEACAALKPKVL